MANWDTWRQSCSTGRLGENPYGNVRRWRGWSELRDLDRVAAVRTADLSSRHFGRHLKQTLAQRTIQRGCGRCRRGLVGWSRVRG